MAFFKLLSAPISCGCEVTINSLQKEFSKRQTQAEQEKRSNTPDSNNRFIYLDGSPRPITSYDDIKITKAQQREYVQGKTIQVGNIGIYFDFEAKKPRTVQQNPGQSAAITLSTPALSNGLSEMDEFMDGMSSFDKDEFRRFRREHPGLSDQEAMSMFKINRGRCRCRGI